MKFTSDDVRSLVLAVCLVAFAIFTDVDKAVVLGFLVGLSQTSPLDR